MIVALLLLSCSSPDLNHLSREYETVEGTLLEPPTLSSNGRRLFLYLQTPGGRVACLAINRERREILAEAQALLDRAGEHRLFVYVTPVASPIEEILGGIDYQVHALGVWIPAMGRHRVVMTGYGDSLLGAMRSVSWQQFLQRMVGKGVDTVL